MESKTLVSYIRDPETRAPNGLVIALDKDTIGWSLLNEKEIITVESPITHTRNGGVYLSANDSYFRSEKDVWTKKDAFDKAIAKAKGLDWISIIEHKLNDTQNPLSPKTAKRFKDDLLPALMRMQDRAKRYFRN